MFYERTSFGSRSNVNKISLHYLTITRAFFSVEKIYAALTTATITMYDVVSNSRIRVINIMENFAPTNYLYLSK